MKGHKLWLWRPTIKKCFISRNVVFKEYEFFKDDREVSSNKENGEGGVSSGVRRQLMILSFK